MTEPQKKKRSILWTIVKVGVVLVLLFVAAIWFVGYFLLDGKYEVSRAITIKAPSEEVHKQVGDLREWPNWLPFTKHDTSVKVVIEKPTDVGAHQHWTGDGGKGELTFTASDPAKGIEFDMLFDDKWASKGALTYAPSGDDTQVTWRMKGQNNDFTGKWMALLMPSMVGPMFEEGLTDLKAKVETK